MKRVKLFALNFCAVAIALSLTACTQGEPGSSDLRESIGQTVPGYTVKNLECKSFASKNEEGAGRADCRGTFVLGEDLYKALSHEEIKSVLVSAGIPQEGSDFFRSRHQRAVVAPTVSQGAETEFSADCDYIGAVEGWQIACRTSYNKFIGERLGSITGQYVVKDSPEFKSYVDEVLTDYGLLNEAYLALEGEIKKFFSSGKVITRASGQEASFRAKVALPLNWEGERGVLGKQGNFWVQAKYQDLTQNKMTPCGYSKGEPSDDILFLGGIRFSSGEQPFTAHVEYRLRTKMFQNRFMGCGSRLTWNGTSWVGGYSSDVELKSS
jgi:hypothetical protein